MELARGQPHSQPLDACLDHPQSELCLRLEQRHGDEHGGFEEQGAEAERLQ